MTNIIIYITYVGKSSSRKLRWVIYYTLYRMGPQTNKTNSFAQQYQQPENYTARRPFGSITNKVMTDNNLYKRCRDILFQKVALGYLLHFVQNGSSKHILKQILLHNNLKNPKNTRPGFHLGAHKNVKL